VAETAFLRHQLLVLKRSAPVADAGLSLKKACAPASKTGPTSRADGTNGKQHQDKVDPKRLVFIDETWMETNMRLALKMGATPERRPSAIEEELTPSP
jgi:hypothetical protein